MLEEVVQTEEQAQAEAVAEAQVQAEEQARICIFQFHPNKNTEFLFFENIRATSFRFLIRYSRFQYVLFHVVSMFLDETAEEQPSNCLNLYMVEESYNTNAVFYEEVEHLDYDDYRTYEL